MGSGDLKSWRKWRKEHGKDPGGHGSVPPGDSRSQGRESVRSEDRHGSAEASTTHSDDALHSASRSASDCADNAAVFSASNPSPAGSGVAMMETENFVSKKDFDNFSQRLRMAGLKCPHGETTSVGALPAVWT
jgi:hypothetical protein